MPPGYRSTKSHEHAKQQAQLLEYRLINGRQSFIKFFPEDDLKAIHPIYLSDPTRFTPKPDSHGDMISWGIVEDEDEGVIALMQKLLLQGRGPFYHASLVPQVQFINFLIKRKKASIAALKSAERDRNDFVLLVRLRKFQKSFPDEHVMWRRIKVAGATKLCAFQDKILAPALGWVRNYHGYLFMDSKDGAQFGPDQATHIDMMHLSRNGHTYINDDQYTIADLFVSVSESRPAFLYLYDLGDQWLHDIYVEDILSPIKSDGKVVLLAGGGACPREDGQSNRNWEKYVQDLTIDKHKEIAQSLNYENDTEVARKRISDALASPASVPSGPKKQHVGLGTPEQMTTGHSGVPKGTHQVITPGDPCDKNSRLFGSFMSETVRDKLDKRLSALCGNCGQPIQTPKMCSACKKVYYCNAQCQKDHWKEHKRLCTRSRITTDKIQD